jgi:hypothetical protein
MLSITNENSASKVIEITIDGEVNQESFDKLAATLEQRIQEWGEVSLLEEVREIGKVGLSNFWKDLKFGIDHRKDFKKAAVVTDITWVRAVSNFFSPLVDVEIEVFRLDEIDQARRWLAEVSLDLPRVGDDDHLQGPHN